MRHLWSFLAGLVAAPLTWILVTLGQEGSARTVDRWMRIGTSNAANLIEPAVYLAVAGVVLGLLATLRVSPLGPAIAGLLLVTPYVGLFLSPSRVHDAVPSGWRVLGDPLPLSLPMDNGTLLLIGLLLFMATFSRQRWRRWPVTAPSIPTSGDRPTPTNERDLDNWPPAKPTADPAGAATPARRPVEPTAAGAPRNGTGSPWSAPPRTTTREPAAR